MGYFFSLASMVFLTITVVLDNLMMDGCYDDNPETPWFVSSFMGAILGSLATFGIWFYLNNTIQLFEYTYLMNFTGITIFSIFMPFSALILLSGILSVLVLRHYFISFSGGINQSVIAACIASAPVFIFGLTMLMNSEAWGITHFIAISLTSIGLIGIELASKVTIIEKITVSRLHLVIMMVYNVLYVVLIDQTLPKIETGFSITNTTAVLISLPYYWLGFGFGIFAIFSKNVQNWIITLKVNVKYLKIIFLLEFTGMAVFFFGFFGIGELPAVIVELIIALHVIPVWLIGIWFSKIYCKIKINGGCYSIFGIDLSEKKLIEFEMPNKQLAIQFVYIIIILTGIVLWYRADQVPIIT